MLLGFRHRANNSVVNAVIFTNLYGKKLLGVNLFYHPMTGKVVIGTGGT